MSDKINIGIQEEIIHLEVAAGGGGVGGGGVAVQGSGSYIQGTGTIRFQTSPTVTFGLASNGVMTASVSQSTHSHPYASSDHLHGSIQTVAISGSVLTNSSDSSGLTLGMPAWLTTAAGGGGNWSTSTQGGSKIDISTATDINTLYYGNFLTVAAGAGAALKGSGTYTQNSGTIEFANSNSITFGLTDNQMTASFSQSTHAHDYLLTANSSLLQHTSATSVVTSAAFPSANTTKFAGTGTTVGATNGTQLKITVNSDGVNLSIPAYITTYAAGGGEIDISAGGSSASLASVIFSNSNNVSFGLNGSTITASASYSQPGATVFSNSNNVTFGLNGSTITASVTVASTSEARVVSLNGSSGSMSLNVGSSLSASSNASAITFGLASNITSALQSAGAYLTTAAQVSHSHGNPTLSLSNLSGATASASNGLTISLTGHNSGYSNTTQFSSAFLTAQSTEPRVVSLNGTSGSLTFNAGTFMGLSQDGVSFTHYVTNTSAITSAAFPSANTTKFAGSGTSLTSTGGTNLAFTLNSNGLSINQPNFITTVADGSIYFSDSNGITFGIATAGSSTTVTGSVFTDYQSTGAYLTTAAGVSHTHGSISTVSTDGTAFTYSSASSGMSFSIPKWITTYAAADASWELEGNNTAGTTSFSYSKLYLSGGQNVTLEGNSNTIIFNVNATGAQDGGNVLAVSGSTASSTGTIAFWNANNFTFGFSDSTRITASFSESTHAHDFVLTANSSLLQHTTATSLITSNAFPSASTTKFAGTGTTIGATNGTLFKVTVNSDGFNASIPAYITTYAAQTLQPIGISGSNTSTTASTISFGNSNSFDFYLTNGSIVGKFTESTHAHSFVNQINGSSGSISLNTGSSLSSSANASGITFGLASNITTALQSANANYLTSQSAQAASASNGSFTFQTLSMGSSIVTFFTNASGIQGSYSQSTHEHTTLSRVIQINGSSGSISLNTGSSLSSSANASGITFGLASNISTAWSGQTTANQSRVVQINGSSNSISFNVGSSLSSSVNASAITFGLASNITSALQSAGAYLVTAAQSNQVVNSFNGSTGQISLVTGSGMSTTTNASTLTFGLRSDISTAWSGQTTANQSRVVQINGSSNSLSFAVGSSLSASSNASTVTFGLASNITTALQSAGAYLTTAAQVSHSHGDVSLSLINITGTYSSASSGLTLSLTAGAGGGGVAIADSASTVSNNTLVFVNSNGLAFGINGSTITGSYTVPIQGTLSFINTNGVSFITDSAGSTTSISASVQTAYVPLGSTTQFAQVWKLYSNTSGTSSSAFGSDLMLNAGDNITLSGGSNGISIIGGGGGAGTQIVAGDYLSSSLVGSTLSLSVTGLQPAGAYLTTAAGTGSTLTTKTGTNLAITYNSDGLNISYPAWITTYAAGGSVDWSVATTNAGTDIIISTGVATNTLYHPAYITVGGDGGGVAIQGSGTYSQNTGTVIFQTGNGLTFGLSSDGVMTGSYTVPPLGTLSFINTHGVEFISAVDGVTTSISASVQTAYIPLANSTKFASGWSLSSSTGGSIAGTTSSSFASGSVMRLVAGSNITLSGNTYGIQIIGPDAGVGGGVALSASNSIYTSGTAVFVGNGNVTVSYNADSILFSAGGGGNGVAISASNNVFSSGTVVLSASTNIVVATGAGSILLSIPDYIPLANSTQYGTAELDNTFQLLANSTLSAGVGSQIGSTNAGTDLKMTYGTNGLSLSYPAWLTTAYSTTSQFSASFVNTGQGYIQSLVASNSTWTKGLVQISGSSNITASYNASTILLSVADAIPLANTTRYMGLGTSTQTTSGTGLAVSGNTAGLTITYPAVGYLSLINSNGYTWSTNVNGVSTGIWLVLAHTA